jgi:hypothetical protein
MGSRHTVGAETIHFNTPITPSLAEWLDDLFELRTGARYD